MTIEEFVAKYPALTLTYAVKGTHVIDGKTPFVWDITLTIGKRSYKTTFTKGAAHIGKKGLNNKIFPVDTWNIQKTIAEDKDRFVRRLVAIPPNMDDVIYCLASDCLCFENWPTWESFADDLGYNVDSIAQKDIFKACRKAHAKLKLLMGQEMFSDFLYVAEE